MKKFNENFKASLLERSGAMCYKKTVVCTKRNSDGAAVCTKTRMNGVTVNGVYAAKNIEIDDDAGRALENIIAYKDFSKPYLFQNCNLTGYRCAEMTSVAISLLYGSPNSVGFIGTGKTNLLNCIAIQRYFHPNKIVVRGSKRNLAKNVGDFMTVCDNISVDTSDDMRLLNECDVVVECCNNCSRAELISANMLFGPKLIVALDCGFLLDESFREKRTSFADWPEQIEEHYNEEFVFDEKHHSFLQMRHDHEPYKKAVVYLYGVAIADAVASERMIEMIEDDGMEKPFVV